MFCRSLFVFLSLWPLWCLSFFDIRILITLFAIFKLFLISYFFYYYDSLQNPNIIRKTKFTRVHNILKRLYIDFSGLQFPPSSSQIYVFLYNVKLAPRVQCINKYQWKPYCINIVSIPSVFFTHLTKKFTLCYNTILMFI